MCLECACKRSLYCFVLIGLLFNAVFKLFNLLIPVIEWEFGNCPFFFFKQRGNKLYLQSSMSLCIFIFILTAYL